MIISIYKAMMDYQKQNNTTDRCFTNASYLADNLNMNGIKARLKVVIACYDNVEIEMHVFNSHVVVELENGDIIDPSYDVNRFKPSYIDKIHQLPLLNLSKEQNGITLKEMVSSFISFMDFANKYNEKGKLYVTDKEYYHKQADFVDKVIRQIS